VRFASVYRDFREAADFHEVLGEIAAEPANDAPHIGFEGSAAETAPLKKH
jgi:transcriptional repressor NrdR